MAEARGRLQKKSFLAIYELEKRGVEPIDMILDVYKAAMKSYLERHGSQFDPGSPYLSIALKAAERLASYKYPTLTAMAIKDISEADKSAKPLTTAEAIKIIQADPFAPPEIKRIDTNELLPIGKPLDAK